MRPLLVRTRPDLDAGLAAHRAVAARVALVPTMGALHAGHVQLLRRARDEAVVVVASVFVNPTQFGPGEDIDRYPRQLAADVALCAAEGVDVMFAPDVDTVYPEGAAAGVTVDPGAAGRVLEGASRPGHFAAVLTVVAKLSGMVRPDVAVFGEKDYQQLVLVQQLARDLCLPVRVLGVPTVRTDDGLAVSSRNAYLDPSGRRAALALSRALAAGAQQQGSGAAAVHAAATHVLEHEEGVSIDYVAVTDLALGRAPTSGAARLLVAARVQGTRLIDNAAVVLGG